MYSMCHDLYILVMKQQFFYKNLADMTFFTVLIIIWSWIVYFVFYCQIFKISTKWPILDQKFKNLNKRPEAINLWSKYWKIIDAQSNQGVENFKSSKRKIYSTLKAQIDPNWPSLILLTLLTQSTLSDLIWQVFTRYFTIEQLWPNLLKLNMIRLILKQYKIIWLFLYYLI